MEERIGKHQDLLHIADGFPGVGIFKHDGQVAGDVSLQQEFSGLPAQGQAFPQIIRRLPEIAALGSDHALLMTANSQGMKVLYGFESPCRLVDEPGRFG